MSQPQLRRHRSALHCRDMADAMLFVPGGAVVAAVRRWLQSILEQAQLPTNAVIPPADALTWLAMALVWEHQHVSVLVVCFAAGGVLCDSWCTPQEHKLEIIATAHPNPTKWPQEDVNPEHPAAEDCEVEATVDPAAAGAAPAAVSATAAAPAAACQPAAPAAAAGPLTEGVVDVSGSKRRSGCCTIQ